MIHPGAVRPPCGEHTEQKVFDIVVAYGSKPEGYGNIGKHMAEAISVCISLLVKIERGCISRAARNEIWRCTRIREVNPSSGGIPDSPGAVPEVPVLRGVLRILLLLLLPCR